MKKFIYIFLILTCFIITPKNIFADEFTTYKGLSLEFDETLDFNFIIASVNEDEEYELLEDIKIELNDGEFSGYSNEHGIITIKDVPVKYTKLTVYNKEDELIFTKHIIFSFGDKTKGYRYNSKAREEAEILNIGLGYEEDDIKNGNIRMDIHIKEDEHLVNIFLASRMLGGENNSEHYKLVIIFAIVLLAFIILYEKAAKMKESNK